MDKNYLEETVRETIELYTSNHKALEVKVTTLSTLVLIEVKADKADHAKIIGKSGRNFYMMAGITEGISKRVGMPIEFRMVDSYQWSEQETYSPPDFPRITEVIRKLCGLLSGGSVVVICKNIEDRSMGDKIVFETQLSNPIEEKYQGNVVHLLKLIGCKYKSRFYIDFKICPSLRS